MSPRAAVTLLIGADPKKPVKNRVTNTDAAFVLREVPIAKSAWQKTAGRILTRRPQISDMGAQMMGPKMKPTLHLALAMYPQHIRLAAANLQIQSNI
jgi:hypothetical protein